MFYSDNGSHFGHHRLPHGKLMPYQKDTNFPLIVHGPGIPEGQKREQLAGSHDIAPTLARMGGASVPNFVDGRNLLSVALDNDTAWPRTAVLSERTIETIPPSWEMMRMESSNYTRYDNGDKEYYDLIEDPLQLDTALGGTADTPYTPRYEPPDQQTRDYYEKRLDTLSTCRRGGTPCRKAEDAPLQPAEGSPSRRDQERRSGTCLSMKGDEVACYG